MTATDSGTRLERALAALRLHPLRNTAGRPADVAVDDQGNLRAANAGRLVVAPGQTVASAWGNTTFDQTVICFASAADRDNQWPTPHRGAVCWLDDVRLAYLYGSNGWVATGPWVEGFQGPQFTGAVYNPAKVIHHLIGRLAGTSDPAQGYLPVITLPPGVTSILVVNTSNQGGIVYVIPRLDQGLTGVQLQTRLYSNGAASASQPYTIGYDIAYQI